MVKNVGLGSERMKLEICRDYLQEIQRFRTWIYILWFWKGKQKISGMGEGKGARKEGRPVLRSVSGIWKHK